MKRKRIPIHEAKEGMCLAESVYTSDDIMIMPKDTILTDKAIDLIKSYEVNDIVIKVSDEDTTPQYDEQTVYLDTIRETEEFKKFENEFTTATADVKNALNSVVTENKEVDVDSLLKNIDDVINKTQNSYHIFDLLQCIRDLDDQTYVHSLNVAMICNVFGRWLGIKGEELRVLTLCGMLHDIGKLTIPQALLTKPAKLTEEEYKEIQKHPIAGYNLLKDKALDSRIKQAALLHHERCDGKGYPYGFTKPQIPPFASIVTIADVYDAMTANRVYRRPLCPFYVIGQLEQNKFTHYDPEYLMVFLNRIADTYIGNSVRLSNGKEAIVVMTNPNNLSKPIVRVKNEFVDLSKQKDIKIEAII